MEELIARLAQIQGYVEKTRGTTLGEIGGVRPRVEGILGSATGPLLALGAQARGLQASLLTQIAALRAEIQSIVGASEG